MFQLPKTALIILSGAAVISVAGAASQTDAHQVYGTSSHDLRCEVVTRDLGGAVEISGKLTADHDIAGEYELRIRKTSGGGHAMIDQSGAFTAASGRTVTLGQATLGGTPGSYEADLELTIKGQHMHCLGAGAHTDI